MITEHNFVSKLNKKLSICFDSFEKNHCSLFELFPEILVFVVESEVI